MPRWLQRSFGLSISLLLVGTPLVYARHRHYQQRNFHVVREGVLYRSGQLPLEGLQSIIHDHHIKTLVTLRSGQRPGEPAPDLAEEEFCKKLGMNHFRLPSQGWLAPDGSVPNEVNVVRFRQIMNDTANYPVLVHCLAGKHRTGAMCAVFRMEHDHWSNAQAIDELRLYGYDNVLEHLDLLGYLEKYQPTWAVTSSTLPQSYSR